jgi:hypothetical protein
MNIRPVVSKLFHAGGRKYRHDEANSRFSQLCEKRLKTRDLVKQVKGFPLLWFRIKCKEFKRIKLSPFVYYTKDSCDSIF